jgi:hypothetical protein
VLVATFAAASIAALPLKLEVTSVSLFKNGYAVVTREAPMAASGIFTFDEFPSAVLGTMWISATSGTKFREIVSTTEETTSETPAQNLDEVLSANVGKVLSVYLGETKLEGKLEGIAGSLIILRGETGTTAIQKAQIMRVASQGELIWKLSRKGSKRVIRAAADAGQNAKILVASLERGATWSPAYSIDISDSKKLKLVARATVLDDTLEIKNVEVRLITGFPNVPFLSYWDPFAVYQSVDQFVNMMMNMGTPAQLRKESGALMQNAAPRDAFRSFDEAFNVPGVQGFSAEDLFFYPLKNVNLKRGDRGYIILFSLQSDYSHVYQWDIPDRIVNDRYQDSQEPVGDVWHSLRFKNTADMPLTTAAATVFKNGEILGQDMLSYTSAGAETLVRMTKALDVRAEDAEEEIERERIERQIRGGYYDLVTLKGTLDITNRKAEDIKLSITKELTGEVVSADMNPKKKSIVRGLRAVNPRQQLTWEIDIKKGEKKTIAYTYKVYVAR